MAFISNCLLQLKDLVKQLLEKQRLTYGDVETYGTPRRLVVWLDSYVDGASAVLLHFVELFHFRLDIKYHSSSNPFALLKTLPPTI